MITGLTRTLCRLFAALVCLLCASEVFGLAVAPRWVPGETELRATDPSEDLDATSEAPDSREEREEREGDDEDDDLDDSRDVSWASFPIPRLVPARSRFPRARSEGAPDKSHLSLDPRPPRRA